MDLALSITIRQILLVRWVGSLLVLLVASVANAGPSSNPAFLGIEMRDQGNGCEVQLVTQCSPAKDAGMRSGDVIVAMEGTAVFNGRQPTCDVLRDRIMARAPGDRVSYEVWRGGDKVTLKAVLSTRADVQHRCFVGQRLPELDLIDLDNEARKTELDPRGKTTVIGWFRLERCIGCGAVFDKITDAITARLRDHDTRPAVLGITQRMDGVKLTRSGFGSTVPVVLASEHDYEEMTLKERDRIQFMVIDCRGVIRFVAPIAPGADDLDAALDEVLAAVEQAEYLRTQRR